MLQWQELELFGWITIKWFNNNHFENFLLHYQIIIKIELYIYTKHILKQAFCFKNDAIRYN